MVFFADGEMATGKILMVNIFFLVPQMTLNFYSIFLTCILVIPNFTIPYGNRRQIWVQNWQQEKYKTSSIFWLYQGQIS